MGLSPWVEGWVSWDHLEVYPGVLVSATMGWSLSLPPFWPWGGLAPVCPTSGSGSLGGAFLDLERQGWGTRRIGSRRDPESGALDVP